MLRLLGLAGLAALAFLATASAIRPFVPLPEDSDLRARVERLASAEEPYDLVVLGPSTTRCGFDPRVFDAEMARLGHPLRSLNLGLPGASSFEIDHLVARIVARRPAGLRWVMIELHPAGFNALIRPHNLFTDRAVWWHTPRQLRAVLATLADRREGQALRPDRAVMHVRHALWRFANVGQADRIAAHALAHDAPQPDPRRGYAPEDCTTEQGQARRAAYLADPQGVRERERVLDRQNETPVDTHHLDPRGIRRQVARLRAIGVEPVYVLTPILSPVPAIHALRREGVLPALLAFDSPRRQPELYELRYRMDELHLNEDGAALFSRKLAVRFARWLETGAES
ncbi:MAG TPA: hypothetical protein VKB65_13845 [Myxococcota bacterium]|nr:hypothetical protein [Myxococcota bacterium]